MNQNTKRANRDNQAAKMTARQASYLKSLTRDAGEEFNPDLTKGEAMNEISRLKELRGRQIAQAS